MSSRAMVSSLCDGIRIFEALFIEVFTSPATGRPLGGGRKTPARRQRSFMDDLQLRMECTACGKFSYVTEPPLGEAPSVAGQVTLDCGHRRTNVRQNPLECYGGFVNGEFQTLTDKQVDELLATMADQLTGYAGLGYGEVFETRQEKPSAELKGSRAPANPD